MNNNDNALIARAKVQVTLEIQVADTWGPTVQMDQIERQAKESALARLNSVKDLTQGEFTVIGTPIVTAVLVQRQK